MESGENQSMLNTNHKKIIQSHVLDYLKLSQDIQEEIKSYVGKLDLMTKGLSVCLDN